MEFKNIIDLLLLCGMKYILLNVFIIKMFIVFSLVKFLDVNGK